MTTKTSHRKQLLDCFIQLSMRAEELNEKDISTCVSTLCGAIMSNNDNQLAIVCKAFSEIKLDELKKTVTDYTQAGGLI